MKVLKSFEDFFAEPAVNTNPTKGDHLAAPGVEVPSIDMADPQTSTLDDHEIEFSVDPEDGNEPELEPEDDEDLDEGKDPYEVTSKDTMRIQDIHDKADGDEFKMKRLAQTMCKLITDASKATRRALAAERLKFYDIADMFFARARELGGA